MQATAYSVSRSLEVCQREPPTKRGKTSFPQGYFRAIRLAVSTLGARTG